MLRRYCDVRHLIFVTSSVLVMYFFYLHVIFMLKLQTQTCVKDKVRKVVGELSLESGSSYKLIGDFLYEILYLITYSRCLLHFTLNKAINKISTILILRYSTNY